MGSFQGSYTDIFGDTLVHKRGQGRTYDYEITLIYSINFIYKKQFLSGMYNTKDILGKGRQTWKLYNTARLISTKALSFQREEKLFVSSPIRFATGYESKRKTNDNIGYALRRDS